jgi:hypothetical protein
VREPATSAAKAAHLHGLATLYVEDGQIERSLLLLMLANLMMPGDVRIMRSLATVTLATGSAARALKIVELLARAGEPETPEMERLRKRARLLASGRSGNNDMTQRDLGRSV